MISNQTQTSTTQISSTISTLAKKIRQRDGLSDRLTLPSPDDLLRLDPKHWLYTPNDKAIKKEIGDQLAERLIEQLDHKLLDALRRYLDSLPIRNNPEILRETSANLKTAASAYPSSPDTLKSVLDELIQLIDDREQNPRPIDKRRLANLILHIFVLTDRPLPPDCQQYNEASIHFACAFQGIAFGLDDDENLSDYHHCLSDMCNAHILAKKTNSNLKHPLASRIRGFFHEQRCNVQPVTRARQILPQEFKDSKRVQGELFPIGESQPSSETLWLPGFENPSVVVPALPLEYYKATGAKELMPGRGAPLSLRLWIYCIAATPLEQRTPDGIILDTSLRHIKDWVYPNGWNRQRHFPMIRQAMVEMHHHRISWKGFDYSLIMIPKLPNNDAGLDEHIPIVITFPLGIKGHGPLINMTVLSHLGVESAPQFRAYLRLAYIWDEAKKKNNGKRIYATRPKVLRNDRGQVIDNNGNLVPKNNWNHRNAVRLGEEENPAACHVPAFTDRDKVHLFFDDKDVSNAAYRKRVERANREAEEMEKKGLIVIRKERREWQFLEPRPNTSHWLLGHDELVTRSR